MMQYRLRLFSTLAVVLGAFGDTSLHDLAGPSKPCPAGPPKDHIALVQLQASKFILPKEKERTHLAEKVENSGDVMEDYWFNLSNAKATSSTRQDGFPSYAVDPSPLWCFTSDIEKNPWFQVKLGSTHLIQAVQILPRGGYAISDATVEVNGQACATNVNIPPGSRQRVACAGEGSTISIQMFGKNKQLAICDFEVSLSADDDFLEDTIEEQGDLAQATADETTNAQETQQDEFADREEGCDAGGASGGSCANASSEPGSPFEESATGKANESLVDDTGKLDFSMIFQATKQRADERFVELQAQKDDQRAKRQDAKANYKTCRQDAKGAFDAGEASIEKWYSDGKTRLLSEKHDGKSECGRDRDCKDSVKADHKGARRQLREDRKTKQFQNRQTLRAAKKACKIDWKNAKGAWRTYKTTLRRARFQAKILPAIWKVYLFATQKNLIEIRLSKGTEEIVGALVLEGPAMAAIKGYEVMQQFLIANITGTIKPPIMNRVTTFLETLWEPINELKDVLTQTLIVAIGSFPYCDALAAMIPGLNDRIFNKLQQTVNTAIEKKMSTMVTKMVTRMVTFVMDKIGTYLNDKLCEDVCIQALPSAADVAAEGTAAKNEVEEEAQEEWSEGMDENEDAVADDVVLQAAQEASEDESMDTQEEDADEMEVS